MWIPASRKNNSAGWWRKWHLRYLCGKIIKLKSTYIVSPGVLRLNYKSKTKLLEDNEKYLHNLVIGKYFLQKVSIQRKSISHEEKYEIFR